MTERVPYGDLLDAAGVGGAPLPADELVVNAVVVLRIVDRDGGTYTRHIWSQGMSWVDRLALLHIGHQVELNESIQRTPARSLDEDEEGDDRP